jgi:Mn2+/Fe2+ NRAMP family transporter
MGKANIIFRGVNNMKEKVQWKLYEIIFFVVAIIFLILASINLFQITHFSQTVESIFYAIFLFSMFIVYVRKSFLIALLPLIAGILFFLSIF